ncbi:uncharacterized protein LOC125236553 [Leguminivora glycinivorella]|uniref:uncharacterized protein LOC125236553 n=1 Tax=Leguminivora glycinivorella TaxID=1035111 RepID=UPI002010799B|nr:uncharacterized protein LOC125236553 [Leguminivora glycinivorella]
MFRFLSLLLFCGVYVIVLGDDADDRANAKGGPFSTIITKMQKCKKTDLPYQAKGERSAEITYELGDPGDRASGPSIIGNYTSLKEDPDLKMNITDFQQVKGKWEPIYGVFGINCYNRLVARFARIFHVRYNKQTCVVPKGTHRFNVDYDAVDHEFQTRRVYGKVLRRVVVTSKKKTVICLEIEAEVAPGEEM